MKTGTITNEFMEHTAQQFHDLWTRTSELNSDLKQVADLVGLFVERQGILIADLREQQRQLGEVVVMLATLTESVTAMANRQSREDGEVAGNAIN